MSMEYIRGTYNVPARRGMRVRYTNPATGRAHDGVILRAVGPYLKIKLETLKCIGLFHPTDGIEYEPR